jgi:hypothetical protein
MLVAMLWVRCPIVGGCVRGCRCCVGRVGCRVRIGSLCCWCWLPLGWCLCVVVVVGPLGWCSVHVVYEEVVDADCGVVDC